MVFDYHGYKHWVETHEDRLLLAGGLVSLPLLVLLFFGYVYRDSECQSEREEERKAKKD